MADFLSSLVGGGLSLLGNQMSLNEAGNLNERNWNQQLFMASGGYLPDLVKNATNAGINPLAVLGVHAPTGGTAVPIGAGKGMQDFGKMMSDVDPNKEALDKAAVDKAKADVDLTKASTTNQNIMALKNQWVLDQLTTRGGRWIPTEATEPSLSGTVVDRGEKMWNDIQLPFNNWYQQFKDTDKFDWSPPGSSYTRDWFERGRLPTE